MIADEVISRDEFQSLLCNLTLRDSTNKDSLDFEQFFELSKSLGARIHQHHLKEVEEQRRIRQISLPSADEMQGPEFEAQTKQQFDQASGGVSDSSRFHLLLSSSVLV